MTASGVILDARRYGSTEKVSGVEPAGTVAYNPLLIFIMRPVLL